MVAGMSDVIQLLNAMDAGDSKAGDQLLPLVYEELRNWPQRARLQAQGRACPRIPDFRDFVAHLIDSGQFRQSVRFSVPGNSRWDTPKVIG